MKCSSAAGKCNRFAEIKQYRKKYYFIACNDAAILRYYIDYVNNYLFFRLQD